MMGANRENFKSNKMCSVVNCSNRASAGKVSLHSFPRCPTAKKAWQYKLRIGKPITPSMRVCSEHFKNEDFMWSNTDLGSNAPKVRHLKKNTIPSLKIPLRRLEKLIPDNRIRARFERAERRARCSNGSEAAHMSHEEHLGACNGESEIVPHEGPSERSKQEVDAVEALIELGNSVPEYKSTADRAIQVNTLSDNNKKFRLTSLLDSDHAVNSLTGVPTTELLTAIVQGVAKLETTTSHLSTEDRVILCLVKIKTNLTFTCIAVLFQASETSVHRYFYNTLPVLASVLGTAVIWPERKHVLQNMPNCFSEFQNVRVIADGTEIEIERTKCLRCRILTYSHYKGRHTVKFLVGVTPDGLLSFVSKGFGGRASDKVTVNKSELLEKLDPFKDAIMVDKGFHIDDDCQRRGIVMVRPPFLKSQTRFSPAQAAQTQKIAKARVHVERSIQRLKVFKLLKGPIPWELLAVIDDIMIVAAGIVNLSQPILSSDKFQ